MKKIYHFAENVTNNSGGIRAVLVNLDDYLNTENKFDSKIITNYKEKEDLYLEYKSINNLPWSYALDVEKSIRKIDGNESCFHIHGVFMHIQYTASKISSKKNIPNIISPHGMLEPWHLNDKFFKKKLYLSLILNTILKKATVLHAITPLEKENLFKLTGHKNIIEIPNLFYFSNYNTINEYNPDEEYMLFLSRLHPKKGLDLLINAMTKIEDKKIKLKIVGEENDYSKKLKDKCKLLGIDNRVEFLGAVYKEEKNNLYSNAKFFVAPSYSEAIGMVNLEAAANKTPVITTYNTGINSDWNKEGGIMINPNVEELVRSINEANSWNLKERKDRGMKLSNYVFENYSWEKKGQLWDSLYNSL